MIGVRVQLVSDVAVLAVAGACVALQVPPSSPPALPAALCLGLWSGYVGFTAAAWWAFKAAERAGLVRPVDRTSDGTEIVYFIANECAFQPLVRHYIRTMR